MTAADRARGVLVGLAAGDRIGGPVRMAVRVAESLADRGGFDPADILARYLDWLRDGAFDTGPVAWLALTRIAAGEPVRQAVAAVHVERGGLTAGCNPAHRAVPLAMARVVADDALAEAASAEAALTHHDPLAGDVSAAVVRLCRGLIQGMGWAEARGWAADGRQPVTAAAVRVGSREAISAGGFAPEVLAAAVAMVDRSPDLSTALEQAVAFAGGANYCPVLVGAIGGARWGSTGVPADGGHVELGERIAAASERLAAEWATGG